MPQSTLEDELLTPEQVSEILSIPRATLYAWRTKGKGPVAFRVGKHLRYRASAVDAWLSSQETE